jgi:hypothetical protein
VIKYYKLIIKTFDQVKKHNFDQLKFDQVIVSPKNVIEIVFKKLMEKFGIFCIYCFGQDEVSILMPMQIFKYFILSSGTPTTYLQIKFDKTFEILFWLLVGDKKEIFQHSKIVV